MITATPPRQSAPPRTSQRSGAIRSTPQPQRIASRTKTPPYAASARPKCAGRVVLEIVLRALEPRRTREERQQGGLVDGPSAVLGVIRAQHALDRVESGLVGSELGGRERTLLLDRLDRSGGGGKVAVEQRAGDRHNHQDEQDLDETEAALIATA